MVTVMGYKKRDCQSKVTMQRIKPDKHLQFSNAARPTSNTFTNTSHLLLNNSPPSQSTKQTQENPPLRSIEEKKHTNVCANNNLWRLQGGEKKSNK